MGNAHEGRDGDNLIKQKCGKQIRRHEQPQRRPQGGQHKRIVSVSVVIMFKIFPGNEGCHHPDKSRDHTVYFPEAIQPQMEVQAAHAGKPEFRRHTRKNDPEHAHQQDKLRDHNHVREIVTGDFILMANLISDQRTDHRPENQHAQTIISCHIPFPSFIMPCPAVPVQAAAKAVPDKNRSHRQPPSEGTPGDG